MIIYIIFIAIIILVNGYHLCKKCYQLLKTSPMIDDMHQGEYSHIGMGMETDVTTGLETNLATVNEPKKDNENPFDKSPEV